MNPYKPEYGQWSYQITTAQDVSVIVDWFQVSHGDDPPIRVGRLSIPVHNISCGIELVPALGLRLKCKDEKQCISYSDGRNDDQQPSTDLLLVNDDQLERLQRAISHLIALLQKQYSETHTDTDPFSK